jgi:hypothetical protein
VSISPHTLSGSAGVAPTLGSHHLFAVLLLVGVVICRLIQPILIFDIELVGDFGAFVVRANRCLILTHMFIVSVIVVIFGAARRIRGKSQPLKVGRRVWCFVSGGHARILLNIITGEPSYLARLGKYPPA